MKLNFLKAIFRLLINMSDKTIGKAVFVQSTINRKNDDSIEVAAHFFLYRKNQNHGIYLGS